VEGEQDINKKLMLTSPETRIILKQDGKPWTGTGTFTIYLQISSDPVKKSREYRDRGGNNNNHADGL
jgi:hypothetical protein